MENCLHSQSTMVNYVRWYLNADFLGFKSILFCVFLDYNLNEDEIRKTYCKQNVFRLFMYI